MLLAAPCGHSVCGVGGGGQFLRHALVRFYKQLVVGLVQSASGKEAGVPTKDDMASAFPQT